MRRTSKGLARLLCVPARTERALRSSLYHGHVEKSFSLFILVRQTSRVGRNLFFFWKVCRNLQGLCLERDSGSQRRKKKTFLDQEKALQVFLWTIFLGESL